MQLPPGDYDYVYTLEIEDGDYFAAGIGRLLVEASYNF